MGLFGDEEGSHNGTSGLFGDVPDTTKSTSRGLFDVEADPWMPSMKRKRDLAGLLNDSKIPERYDEIFNEFSVNNNIPVVNLRMMMENAHISENDKEAIVSTILSGDTEQVGIARGLTYVVLVLLYMAQQGEEISIDAVDDRKSQILPVPKIDRRSDMSIGDDSPSISSTKVGVTPSDKRMPTTDSSLKTSGPVQNVLDLDKTQAARSSDKSAKRPDLSDPWSPIGSHQGSQYQEEQAHLVPPTQYNANSTQQNRLEIDTVTIRALDGKEGLPLWKHINYEVKSSRRKSSVVRRYSDFAWLLECLLKQYPFRQIPLLPPKRLAVHGIHIYLGKQADISFLEKRRRGLSRFVNALERHPVLKADQLVTTFLTVPTELAVWRKQASITVKEEFEDRYLSPDLESSLPQGIEDWMLKTMAGLKGAIETFHNLTILQERLVKRQEANGVDLLRFSLSLNSYCEREQADFAILGKENGPGLVSGLKALSKHHTQCQQLVDKECRNTEDELFEDLKRHRDTLSAMSEVFVRHAKYSGNNIPFLEKRIASCENKLSVLRSKPDAKEADKSKQQASIDHDQATIVKLQSRDIFIRECVWQELQFFATQQIHISKLINDMAAARLSYTRAYADVAAAFVGDVEGMP